MTTPAPVAALALEIIAQLQAGVMPWRESWHVSGAPLRANGARYQGINALSLALFGSASGYLSPYWMTYRQALALGGQVRKGEKARQAVFWGTVGEGRGAENTATSAERAAAPSAGGEDLHDAGERRRSRFCKISSVFNAQQIDGLPGRFYPLFKAREMASFVEPVEAAVLELGVGRHIDAEPHYNPVTDSIGMPPREAFKTDALYVGTLGHEASHSTGHAQRLDRRLGLKYGRDAYFVEELVAELSAAHLGRVIGFAPSSLDNHARYIGSWIELMRRDPSVLMTAAAAAGHAAEYILARAQAAGIELANVAAEPATAPAPGMPELADVDLGV